MVLLNDAFKELLIDYLKKVFMLLFYLKYKKLSKKFTSFFFSHKIFMNQYASINFSLNAM